MAECAHGGEVFISNVVTGDRRIETVTCAACNAVVFQVKYGHNASPADVRYDEGE